MYKREHKNRLEFDLYMKVWNILMIKYYNIILTCSELRFW